MLKYVIKDISSMLYVIPYGLVVGLLVFFLAKKRNAVRCRIGKPPISVPAAAAFYMYAAVLLVITFFSRESGSEHGLDLELFSTFRINVRNTAYVIENILLFIPFGYVCPWYCKGLRGFGRCSVAGFLTTLLIESLQLITGRGVFQVDDILTNLLGSMLGYFCFVLIWGRRGRRLS